jgi:hypothetical protein
MKKILCLFPLFLGMLACGAQPLPTQDVSTIVNATLTAIAQNNLQVVPPQPTFTSTGGDQKPDVKIRHIEMQQGAQACTNNAEYIISARITGTANTQVSYTVSSENNGTTSPDAGATIMLDNNGGYDLNTGIMGPFSDPANVKITITLLVNGQADNYADGIICQGGQYEQ